MSDVMMFPKTVDEFMEQYKIVDTDKVYTNGAELVPIFRMKQWFEHVDAEPVRHGMWIMEFDEISQRTDWHCSLCGKHGRGDYKRCPWCGAKMDL